MVVTPKFLIKKTDKGSFVFHLKAANAQTICTSQPYTTMTACKAGIESIRKNCGSPIEDQTLQNYEPLKGPRYELYNDKAGEFRFRLKASNGQNILASQGYADKSGCKNGIKSIANNAPKAEVEVEETE
jgi:uncharacterized protein YegP (UPF0339 family)